MNRRLTHTLVGIVTAILIAATAVFSFVVTPRGPAGGVRTALRRAIPAVVHPVSGSMAACAGCHVTGLAGMPRSHGSFDAATCLTCHGIAPVTTSPAAAETDSAGSGEIEARSVPHPVVAPYADCAGCHGAGGKLGWPDDHADFTIDTCTGCHAGPTQEAGRADSR